MTKSTHVIEDYSVSEDTIHCVCGWSGFTADFKPHQKTSKPTKEKPSEIPFSGKTFPVLRGAKK